MKILIIGSTGFSNSNLTDFSKASFYDSVESDSLCAIYYLLCQRY